MTLPLLASDIRTLRIATTAGIPRSGQKLARYAPLWAMTALYVGFRVILLGRHRRGCIASGSFLVRSHTFGHFADRRLSREARLAPALFRVLCVS